METEKMQTFEDVADILYKVLLELLSWSTFHGHKRCCGTHKREHKDDCVAYKAILLYQMRKRAYQE